MSKRAYLYINPKGYPVTRHSYSGSSTFNHCARKYFLERVAGYKEKALDNSASMEFGRVMEACVVAYHSGGLEIAKKHFITGWGKVKEKKLDYSDKCDDWTAMSKSGIELLRLYDIRYPSFPFEITGADNFQVCKTWEVFPNTDFAGIELYSYIDVLAKLKPGRFKDAKTDKAILDMKVSAAACPKLVALDPQLRTYSMVTKYPVVGFLWLGVERRKLEAGKEVTLLSDIGSLKKGNDVTIISLDFKEIPTTPESVYVTDDKDVLKALSLMEGRKAIDKENKLKFIQTNGTIVPVSEITRQTVEVNMATISDDSREDIKRQIEQDVIRITNAFENDFWPMQGGVRYPNNKCVTCPMRGICTGNNDLRDELLERTEEPVF